MLESRCRLIRRLNSECVAAGLSQSRTAKTNTGIQTNPNIQTRVGRSPIGIRGTVGPERKTPFTVGPHRIAPLLDTVVIVRRLTVGKSASIMGVTARSKRRTLRRCWQFDRCVLGDPLSGESVVRIIARKRQPIGVSMRSRIGDRGEQKNGNEQGMDYGTFHECQNSSRSRAGREDAANLLLFNQPEAPQSSQPAQSEPYWVDELTGRAVSQSLGDPRYGRKLNFGSRLRISSLS